MSIAEAIACLEAQLADPAQGLPEEVFLFASRITPLVNVDLLVKDARGRVLLAWRDDCFAGRGWHVPGGIVRFKEALATRVRQVAARELGAAVEFDPAPMAVHELVHPSRPTRGHFVSLLYRCRLPADYVPDNSGRGPADAGYLQWHAGAPANLIAVHEIYRPYLE